jgi:prepilin-type N-terminal cleavage/methylation domain-containing protein
MRRPSGFTMIELMISIGIMVMLTAIFIGYNRTTRDNIALMTERARLGQLIARAKSLALSSYTKDPQPCAYGVHLDYAARTYALVGYDDPVTECSPMAFIDPANFRYYETFSVRPGVVLDAGGPNPLEDVFFVAPDPVTYLNIGGALTTSGSGNVTIKTQDGATVDAVTVTGASQITF